MWISDKSFKVSKRSVEDNLLKYVQNVYYDYFVSMNCCVTGRFPSLSSKFITDTI